MFPTQGYSARNFYMTYSNFAYTHQGWFIQDQVFYLGRLNDEVEFDSHHGFSFDFTDLTVPVLHHTYLGKTNAIDHKWAYVREG